MSNNGLIVSDNDESPKGSIGVTLQIRAKHADLLAAARKLGSATALAIHLGVEYRTVSRWINLESVPPFHSPASPLWSSPERVTLIEQQLFDLTGKTLDELWPEFIRSEDFLSMPKTIEITSSADAHGLALQQGDRLSQLTPLQLLESQELSDAIAEVIKTLPNRYATVLRKHYGIDCEQKDYDAIGRDMGITRERVRQLEKKAMRMIQETRRIDKLAELTEFDQ